MENKPTLKASLIFIITCLCVLLPDLVKAQDRNIYEITKNASLHTNDRQHFYNLAFNLNTTAYLKDNSVINKYGQGVVLKVTMEDTKSIEVLVNKQNEYNQAEIIIIKVNEISELYNSFDLTTLTEMNNLKYVYIKCSFKCEKNDIDNFVITNPSVRIFYNAEKPH